MTPPDRPVSARLEELRRLREAGTGRPWTLASMLRPDYFSEGWTFLTERGRVGHLVGGNEADAALIVAAVNAFAALIDLAEAAYNLWNEHTPIASTDQSDSPEMGCSCGWHSDGEGGWWEHLPELGAALGRLNTEDGAGR